MSVESETVTAKVEEQYERVKLALESMPRDTDFSTEGQIAYLRAVASLQFRILEYLMARLEDDGTAIGELFDWREELADDAPALNADDAPLSDG